MTPRFHSAHAAVSFYSSVPSRESATSGAMPSAFAIATMLSALVARFRSIEVEKTGGNY